MTYLELCQRLAQKAGIPYDGLSDVTSVTGELDHVVQWVYDAYLDIQTEQSGEWKFLHTEFTKATVASTQDYEFYTADGVIRFDTESFYYYLTADGANQRSKLRYVEYKEFKQKYTDFSTEGVPAAITITPDKKLRLYPIPDAVYTIEADAFLKPEELSVNASTPSMPSNFHMMIVWKALIDYAGFEESGAAFQHAALRFDSLFNQLLWQEKYEKEMMVVRPQ